MSIYTLFRSCVVATTLFYIAYWFLPYTYGYLDYEIGNVLSYYGHGAIIELHPNLDYPIFISWVLIAIGLFFYINIARTAFMIMTVIFLAISPLLGLSVETAGGLARLGLMAMLDGAIIIMAFFTPVASKFTGSNKSSNLTGAENAPPS